MTWLGDRTNRTHDVERERLILLRADIVKEIEQLKKNAPPFRTESAKKFHQEDLLKLAREVIKIDEKLGRNPHA